MRSLETCPLCGYDLSGEVATWGSRAEGSWPVRLRCSECGGQSETGDVVGLRGPRWSFEHARWGRTGWARSRGAVRSWGASVAGTFAPGWLWARLRPEHEPVPRRIAVLSGLGLAVGHLIAVAAVGVSALVMVLTPRSPMAGAWRDWDVGNGAWWGRVARAVAWPIGEQFGVPEAINASSSTPMWTMAVMVYTPLMAMALAAMVLDGATRRGERSRWHVGRVWAFSLYPGAAMVGLMAVTMAAMGVARAKWWPEMEPVMGLIVCWGVWIGWVWRWWWHAGTGYLAIEPRWLLHACIAGACLLALPAGMVVEWAAG